MSESIALLIRNDSTRTITITERFKQLESEALEQSALIAKVNDAASDANCTEAMKAIAQLLKQAEETRKAAKAPVLEFGTLIDDTVKLAIKELKAEQLRLARLQGDFEQDKIAQRKAYEAAENRRLSELERQRQAELAIAATPAKVEEINERHAAIAADKGPEPAAQIQAPGKVVTEDWDVQISDAWLLARAHPTCVTIGFRIGEIKSLLKAGVKVQGVIAEKIVKVNVRAGRKSTAIEI